MRARVWSVVSCSWVHQEPSSSGRAMVWGTATSWKCSHSHHFFFLLYNYLSLFFIMKAVVFNWVLGFFVCLFFALSSWLPLFKAPVLRSLSCWILILIWKRRSYFSWLCFSHRIHLQAQLQFIQKRTFLTNIALCPLGPWLWRYRILQPCGAQRGSWSFWGVRQGRAGGNTTVTSPKRNWTRYLMAWMKVRKRTLTTVLLH